MPEDGNVPEKATIVEVETASAAKNMGRAHENRGKTTLSTKLTERTINFGKASHGIDPDIDKVSGSI